MDRKERGGEKGDRWTERIEVERKERDGEKGERWRERREMERKEIEEREKLQRGREKGEIYRERLQRGRERKERGGGRERRYGEGEKGDMGRERKGRKGVGEKIPKLKKKSNFRENSNVELFSPLTSSSVHFFYFGNFSKLVCLSLPANSTPV
jgi:hypothetical protein